MLYYQNLEEIVFARNQLIECDELLILSGYVGSLPVRRLAELPIKTTVIYGMYGVEGIRKRLHTELISENQIGYVQILYSTIPVHSKCYIWMSKGNITQALIGSANFTINGLTTPYREVLAETTRDTFNPLNDYIRSIIEKSICCDNAVVKENLAKVGKDETEGSEYNQDICTLPLYVVERGQRVVPSASGLNWGLAGFTGSHVNIQDAYIPIRVDLIRHYPEFFPKKQEFPDNLSNVIRVDHRHNDNIEILWDDGNTMQGLLEGTQPVNINNKRENYPKQISTTPHKAQLGAYLRKRLGLVEGEKVTYQDLERYGRSSIDVTLQGEGIYYFDFSVPG